MNTTIFKIDENNIDPELIAKASSLLTEGELVAFPTETVYGLGAIGLDEKACQKIFIAKGRPSDNPLILHISDEKMLYNLVDEVSEHARLLIKNCWPGPLTIIFKKKDIIPDIISAGLDTVAIRYPSNKIAQSLIAATGKPIAAPSANISGRPSPTNANDVYRDMEAKIPLIIDGGSSDIGIESTVIDVSSSIPTILRPGYYTYEDIKQIIPEVKLDDSLIDSDQVPKSPGQKYTHYAPKAMMEVYYGSEANYYMADTAYEKADMGLKVGVITFDDSIELFKNHPTLSFGPRGDLESMSHNLFSYLRKMDDMGVDLILAEGVEEIDLGKSIMNRMRKSASGNVFNIGDI